MDLKYSQVAQLSELSNDKIVNLIKNKIAESENAAAALVFDDKIVVLNEDNERFYAADYKVDNNALSLTKWEPMNLVPDNDTRLEELSEKLFDPSSEKEITSRNLVEAFQLKYSSEPVRILINKTAIEKKSIVESNSRIKAIREARKTREAVSDDIVDLMEDSKISALLSRIKDAGATQASITSIDFKSPISVSLFEEESSKVINVSAKKKSKKRNNNIKKKVKNMWTSESFKSDLSSFIAEMADSEDAKETLEKFVNQHVEILILEESELEDLILKTSLMVGESKKSDSLAELFKEYYNLEETKTIREEYISRNSLVEAEEEAPAEDPEAADAGAEPEEPKESDKETSIDEDSINKILKIMTKIRSSLEDKTTEAKYVESFVDALEDAKVGSIGEGKLKEILDFLNSIYERAQEKEDKEEE